MEVTPLFPNFIFSDKFNKHEYYKNDVNLFRDFNIDDLESNVPKDWDCKLNTNFPGKEDGLLNSKYSKKLYEDILSFLDKSLEKYNIGKLFYTEPVWYNIYMEGFNQERHNHLSDKNIISGCYYY